MAEVDVETLEARLTAELAAVDGITLLPPYTIAWTRIGD